MPAIMEIGAAFWAAFTAMAPYLLFGFLVAGILSVMMPPEMVERHLGGRGVRPVFKAALFGIPLPLCSCSVIPVVASLRKHGASKGASTAFLISTPQTGVDSILVTYSLLGPVFAIFRPLAALFTGVLGGMLVEWFDGAKSDAVNPAECKDACCAPGAGEGRVRRVLRYGFVKLPREIAGPLLGGLVIAGLIAAFVPERVFTEWIGRGFGAMLWMMLLGIPMYVCATASVPIAAAMMLKGLSPGAALVFLMTGPATNAAAIASFWRLLGARATMLYLAAVGLGALFCGWVLDLLFATLKVSAAQCAHETGSPVFAGACAILLLGLLVAALLPASWFTAKHRVVGPEKPEDGACCCGHKGGQGPGGKTCR